MNEEKTHGGEAEKSTLSDSDCLEIHNALFYTTTEYTSHHL